MKRSMILGLRPQRYIAILGLGIMPLLFSGCDRQEIIGYFNSGAAEAVDNISDTENVVDNVGEEVANDGMVPGDVAQASGTVQAGSGQSEIVDETEEPYTGPTVSLIMVGDILFHTPVAESGVQEDGSYNYDALFANVKDEIEGADLALVNQEVIIGGDSLGISGYPSFNAPYELGNALAETGFDVVLHATNHTLDQGKKGVRNCLSFWKNEYPDMAVIGINESQDAQDNNIYVYEQDGIRIAILNYTYGTNGIALPSDMPYAVNLLEEDKVVADIEKARGEADFIIVCPHWGTEYQLTPSAEQERWTEIFLENGVDLVIGTHPHVIQPIEWIPCEDEIAAGNGTSNAGASASGAVEADGMLVYYSLGNFVNWTSSSGEGIANRMVGGMAEITIGIDENGDGFIVDYGVEPLVCHVTEGTNGVTTYLLEDYTDEMAAENAIRQQDSAFSKEYCEALCEEVWGDLVE